MERVRALLDELGLAIQKTRNVPGKTGKTAELMLFEQTGVERVVLARRQLRTVRDNTPIGASLPHEFLRAERELEAALDQLDDLWNGHTAGHPRLVR